MVCSFFFFFFSLWFSFNFFWGWLECTDDQTELPEYTAGAAYRVIELLLGRIGSLGEVGDFTTQTGNFTGTSTIYRR